MEQNKAIMAGQPSGNLLPLTRVQRQLVIYGSLLVGDGIAIWLAFELAYQLRFNLLDYPIFLLNPEYYNWIRAVTVPIWLVLMWVYRLYSPKVLFGGLEEYGRVFNVVTTGSVFLVILDFMVRRSEGLSRGWLIILWLVGGLLPLLLT